MTNREPTQVTPSQNQELTQVTPSQNQELTQVTPSQNQELRITRSEKSGKKNPGRVEAGKWLAQWSKEAKKKREESKGLAEENGSTYLPYVFVFVGLTGLGLLAYGFRDKVLAQLPKTESKPEPVPTKKRTIRVRRLACD